MGNTPDHDVTPHSACLGTSGNLTPHSQVWSGAGRALQSVISAATPMADRHLELNLLGEGCVGRRSRSALWRTEAKRTPEQPGRGCAATPPMLSDVRGPPQPYISSSL
jgi:hypothetical protein